MPLPQMPAWEPCLGGLETLADPRWELLAGVTLEEVLVDLVEEVRAGDGEGLHLEQCLGPQLEDQLEVDMGLLLVR